jgi:predicted deacylase
MARSIRQFQYAGDKDGPHLLITAGVHGDEFESIRAVWELIQRFKSDASLMGNLHGRLTLVPMVNDEACRLGQRCGEDEKDLARHCPGDPDGSPTEQTAWALSELIRGADYYIDLHTGGTAYSVYPLAGYTLHPDGSILDAQRRMARAFNLPVIWGTAANLDGRSLSVARDANVPAIYCEYLGSGRCDSRGVAAYVEGSLNVMAELELLDQSRPESRVKHLIEDPTPGSGHMQIQNPAPVKGFFEPAVPLGTEIQAGRQLGVVYDIEDNRPFEILAPRDGLVLVLRTYPLVEKGESVGVIAAQP